MDLVRKILTVYADHAYRRALRDLAIEGYSEEQIGHHVYLRSANASLTHSTPADPLTPDR
jgi:hypothetical protein